MSGIVGLYYLNNRPLESLHLERMATSIAHRGPDEAGTWQRGPVGLGQRMLWTTPESLDEKLPLAAYNNNLAITADARIDNRAELITRLELNDCPAADIADSHLILAAYEKWGDHCPEHLAGDFAFAIWDNRRQSLFCARDHFGIKPFYYYQSEQLFAFGSEIKALLTLPDITPRLNELMVGYHLAAVVGDNAVTFYQDIFRLPPRHSLTITPEGAQLQPYWTPDPSRELRLGSDEEYAEAFREIFREAVTCRLRSAYPLGSELSGGLDSSSVTCMARKVMMEQGNQQPLHVFSAVNKDIPEADESEFINAVLAQGNMKPHTVYLDNISPLADMERVFWKGDETFTTPTVYIPWELCRQAQAQGVRVLLSGLDGDTLVSHGWEYLIDLARTARWDDFARETKAIDKHQHLPNKELLLIDYGFPYLTEMARKGRLIAFMQGVNGLSKHFNIGRRGLVRTYGLKPLAPAPIKRAWQALRGRSQPAQNGNSFINPDFARRIALDEHLASIAYTQSDLQPTARAEQSQAFISDVLPYMFEWSNRTRSTFSIEDRHPFADKRLAEFCLALPPEQKLHQGWTRLIMRRGMEGILPEKIQWRPGKTASSLPFINGFSDIAEGLLEDVIVKEQAQLQAYVNIDPLRRLYNRFLARKATEADIMQIWQATTLALWLRHTRFEEVI